ncbi:MAG: ATP-binding cassette domain-containing protein [Pseudobdellovibrionaceae bacterium]
MIECKGLGKSFRIYKKEPGIAGSFKSFFHREFKENFAVRDFNLNVKKGEIVGLLGPNGAGKTTLMKLLTGIIVPTAGEAKVLGMVPHERSREFRKKIALVMGQKSQLWWDIPAMDSLLLLQKYYEITDAKFKDRVGFLSELLGVKDLLEIHIRKLSLGERMKMELMASLLHEPDVMFLDEPTIGLDVVAQENIRNFLMRYQREKQTTIVLTSHYMADVEALCERIVLILGGQKKFDDSLTTFQNLLGKNKFVTFTFSHQLHMSDPFFEKYEPVWQGNGLQVDLRVPDAELRSVASRILQEYPVVDFYTEQIPIERVMKSVLATPDIVRGGSP